MTRSAWLCLLCLAGCNDQRGIDLERMKEQYRDAPYAPDPFFADGRSLRHPPPETVSRERKFENDPAHTGIEHEHYVQKVPIALDRDQLLRGRERFEIFCATCHGRDGDGRSQVAENMRLRRPPSFFEPPVSELPVGRVYAVISQGYGLMPAYSRQLTSEQRWAVAAYLDVLRLSRLGIANAQEMLEQTHGG